jgi:hypothetical protein
MYPHTRVLPSYEGVGHIDTRCCNIEEAHYPRTKHMKDAFGLFFWENTMVVHRSVLGKWPRKIGEV